MANAHYNAAIEGWGDRVWSAGARLCRFFAATDMPGWISARRRRGRVMPRAKIDPRYLARVQQQQVAVVNKEAATAVKKVETRVQTIDDELQAIDVPTINAKLDDYQNRLAQLEAQ
ncbi:hypothetical protein [Croceicoccus sp. YJ47]|uniref:hypothetical protein n=1 Tax=Croceicoccus sp. YJ47 TaxID=2798724 RepID=UPI0019246729|nr:hypothetical protein [Croceicoccus sp. YJ47]QQN75051.1 hypothetical protein JD971_04965 [Croceicoccus sp. YJ47]